MKKFLLLFFILFSISSGAISAQSPVRLYFETPETHIAPGSVFEVTARIDSTEPVNAFSFRVLYSTDILELVSVNMGGSIIDFLLKDPAVREGSVSIEGGASTPFTGSSGELATLRFRAKGEGSAQVSFGETRVHYADGKGTKAETITAVLFLKIDQDGATLSLDQKDKNPPHLKEVELTKNPIENTPIIVFRAVDEGSGVLKTEARTKRWFFWSDWQSAETPFRVPQGAWAVELRVTDNEGNITHKTLYSKDELIKKLVGIVIVIVMVALSVLWIKKRKKNRFS